MDRLAIERERKKKKERKRRREVILRKWVMVTQLGKGMLLPRDRLSHKGLKQGPKEKIMISFLLLFFSFRSHHHPQETVVDVITTGSE